MIWIGLLFALVSAPSDSLWEPRAWHAFDEAMRASLSGQYNRADSIARAFQTSLQPEAPLLAATVDLSKFADLHDPARLESARRKLATVESEVDGKDIHSRFLRVLTLSQLSYLASLEGRQFASALDGRKAASLAQDLVAEGCDTPELRGMIGGYLFWKAQSLGALAGALGGDTRNEGLKWTQTAAASSSPFREAFRTSLLWIHFERKEYDKAMAVAQEARSAYPENRLYRQAEGDVYFRLDRLAEALDNYRTSWLEYKGLEAVPANRLAAAGNLARIHSVLGHADSAKAWLDTLDAPRYTKVRKWLPPSLVRELEPIRKKLLRP